MKYMEGITTGSSEEPELSDFSLQRSLTLSSMQRFYPKEFFLYWESSKCIWRRAHELECDSLEMQRLSTAGLN
jgi:hypothetical protein